MCDFLLVNNTNLYILSRTVFELPLSSGQILTSANMAINRILLKTNYLEFGLNFIAAVQLGRLNICNRYRNYKKNARLALDAVSSCHEEIHVGL